jgi:hypothetical protein
MGNKSNKSANILVRTDQPYYIAGGVVTGHVFVNCLTPFDGNQLMLFIEGKNIINLRKGVMLVEGTKQC